MAKKKRRGNSGPIAASTGGASAASATFGTPAASKEYDSHADTGAPTSAAADLGLVLRAVSWLGSNFKAGRLASSRPIDETVLEALQPLVLARAAKYEEDSKTANAAAAGSHGPSHKRPRSAAAGTDFTANLFHNSEPLRDEDIGPTIKSIRALLSNPDSLLGKECKPLRAALHPLVEAHMRQENASPAFRVTCMLGQRKRWAQVLPLLAGMRTAEPHKRPKLGAYMRWVRELNVAEGDGQELAMLDAIMRTAAGLPLASSPSPTTGSMQNFPAFNAASRGVEDVAKSDASDAASSSKVHVYSYAPGAFSVIAHESALERKPPNHHDLDIFTCAPGVIAFDAAATREVARHPVPGVEGAFVLSHVLSSTECASLCSLSEAIGYRPDVPLSSAADIRAQNVVIFASEAQNDALFARVKDLLPPELDGDRLFGLNRRWRLYRYHPGNVYRKHLDGAWPASGTQIVGAAGGRQEEYLYDAYGGSTRSKFTFIVYLSEGFEGGATTFFVPSPDKEGVLESRPVKPQLGFAAAWMHGDTGIPLLHEGSPVTSGTKYLLRTEVVYQSRQSPEERRNAARLRGLARQIGKPANIQKKEPEDEDESIGKAGKLGKKQKVIKDKLKSGKFTKKNRKSTSKRGNKAKDAKS